MKRFRLLTTKYLFSWPVFILSLIWSLFLHFSDSATNQSTNYLARAVIVLGSTCLMFVVMYVIATSMSYRIKPSSQPKLLIATVAIASMVRGAVLSYGLEQLSDSGSYPLINRVLSSLTNLTLEVVLTTIVFGSLRTHYSRKVRLISENDHLATLTSAANSALSHLDNASTEPIRQELLFVVNALPLDNAVATREILKATIDEVVRPLSHALEREPQWKPPTISKKELRIDWKGVISEGATPNQIYAGWILLGLMSGVLPNLAYEVGFAQALVFAMHATIFGAVLFTSIRWIALQVLRISRTQSPLLKHALYFFALLIAGILLGQYARAFLAPEHGRIRFLIMAPVATVISGSLVSILNSVFSKVDEIEEALEHSAEKLSWTLAKTREIKRHAERTLANILHGKVQAAFAAAYLRIDMEIAAGRDARETVSVVRRSLREFILGLDFGYAIPEELAVTVSRVRTTWLGVADITFDIEPELEKIVNHDIFCLTTINDLLPELCFNSINHGKAQRIEISVVKVQDRVIELVAVDNGASELVELRQGMGTRLLDECAMRWSRSRADGHTIIRITLPVEEGYAESLLS